MVLPALFALLGLCSVATLCGCVWLHRSLAPLVFSGELAVNQKLLILRAIRRAVQ